MTQGAAGLLSITTASEPRALSQLATLAVSQVAGCSAATAVLWRDREPAVMAASHPDVTRLVDVQLGAGRGPVLDALATGTAVSCPDTLAGQRWPEYETAALSLGVRCSITLPYLAGPSSVTVSLLGARPRAMDPDQVPLAELLVAFGGALVGVMSDYDHVQRTAVQLRDAAEGRSLVDQAKGILMHALGCTADEALERMRQVSQRTNMRATEVARTIIDAHAGQARWPADMIRAGKERQAQRGRASRSPRTTA